MALGSSLACVVERPGDLEQAIPSLWALGSPYARTIVGKMYVPWT